MFGKVLIHGGTGFGIWDRVRRLEFVLVNISYSHTVTWCDGERSQSLGFLDGRRIDNKRLSRKTIKERLSLPLEMECSMMANIEWYCDSTWAKTEVTEEMTAVAHSWLKHISIFRNLSKLKQQLKFTRYSVGVYSCIKLLLPSRHFGNTKNCFYYFPRHHRSPYQRQSYNIPLLLLQSWGGTRWWASFREITLITWRASCCWVMWPHIVYCLDEIVICLTSKCLNISRYSFKTTLCHSAYIKMKKKLIYHRTQIIWNDRQ